MKSYEEVHYQVYTFLLFISNKTYKLLTYSTPTENNKQRKPKLKGTAKKNQNLMKNIASLNRQFIA